MSRKHMPLIIGGVAALLLAVALFFWLFSAKGSYSDGAMAQSLSQRRLNTLSSRSVFPSPPNVQVMTKQLEVYEEYLHGLFASMREGQISDEPVDRDRFIRLLEDGLRRLLNAAREKSIVVPANVAFGVQRYIDGALPADDELPRLVNQFRSINALCDVLYEAGIGELVSVERTVFEREALAVAPAETGFRSRRNSAETETVAPSTELYTDPDGLFTREHYVMVYRAKDDATWKVLDRLSKGAPFVIVTKVEISNPAKPVVVPPKTEEKEAAPKPVSNDGWSAPGSATTVAAKEEEPILPRELRVVAGQELSTVRLELDLYHFTEVASADQAGEVSP